MEKAKEILNSWWFQGATTGAAGVALLAYGYDLYGGIAIGWALCKTIGYLKSA